MLRRVKTRRAAAAATISPAEQSARSRVDDGREASEFTVNAKPITMSKTFRPRAPRRKVVLPAKMRAGAGQVDVCIRDVSARGMLVQAGVPPPRGTYVEILRPGYSVTGRVVWTRQHKFGIEAQATISLAGVLDRRHVASGTGALPPLQQGGARCPRPADAAARSRSRGAMLQYALLGGAATLCALALAAGLYRGLSETFMVVMRHLR